VDQSGIQTLTPPGLCTVPHNPEPPSQQQSKYASHTILPHEIRNLQFSVANTIQTKAVHYNFIDKILLYRNIHLFYHSFPSSKPLTITHTITYTTLWYSNSQPDNKEAWLFYKNCKTLRTSWRAICIWKKLIWSNFANSAW
jgi:hypothetical protein